MTTGTLPPGTHPGDPSLPAAQAELHHERAVPLDSLPPQGQRGRKPYGVDNAEALPTFERAASTWATGMVVPNANQGGTARVVGRTPGRRRIRLWVPASVIIAGVLTNPTPAGVMFAEAEGDLQAGGGGSPINVGDQPVDIFSEGGVWVAPIPGQTVGYVCYLHEWSPAGGGLDF